MAFSVFMHRADSSYDDLPAERYQFPRQYLSRVQASIGDWVLYLEPAKVRASRGYFAIARVQQVIPDPSTPGMYLAVIEPGSYLDFANPVSFNDALGPVERGLLNDEGKLSGAPSRRSGQLRRLISIASSSAASMKPARRCHGWVIPGRRRACKKRQRRTCSKNRASASSSSRRG